MAVDMFITLGDKIKGETKDDKMSKKGACDVLSWSWGISNGGSFHMGGGGGAGKANFGDLSIAKYVDSATPALMKACMTGEHIEKCQLTCRKAGGEQENYIELTMTKCIITQVTSGGSGGEDRFMENVVINFAEVKFEYFGQGDDGIVSSKGVVDYNIQENKIN